MELVNVLAEDPSLAAGLTDEQRALALRIGMTPALSLDPGDHEPDYPADRPLAGLLMIDGLLIREVSLAGRTCGELVCPGAVLRPWDDFGASAPMPYEVRWRILSRMSLAVLDHRWLAMASRWPPIIDSLLARVTERSHALALSVGIHTLRHVRTRLLVLFWHMADRFGKVTPDGVVLDVPLRHSDLAQLTGATRPSVSDALSQLAREGEVTRRPDRTWLLSRTAPAEVVDLRPARTPPRSRRSMQPTGAD